MGYVNVRVNWGGVGHVNVHVHWRGTLMLWVTLWFMVTGVERGGACERSCELAWDVDDMGYVNVLHVWGGMGHVNVPKTQAICSPTLAKSRVTMFLPHQGH